jgi:hypothetical protein
MNTRSDFEIGYCIDTNFISFSLQRGNARPANPRAGEPLLIDRRTASVEDAFPANGTQRRFQELRSPLDQSEMMVWPFRDWEVAPLTRTMVEHVAEVVLLTGSLSSRYTGDFMRCGYPILATSRQFTFCLRIIP